MADGVLAGEADGDAPDRSWTTEVGVARDGKEISAQIRLVCAAPEESPPARSVPGLVRWLADRFGVLADGRQDVLAIATGDRGDPSTALV